MSWPAWVDQECASIAAAGRWRRPRPLAGPEPLTHLVDDGLVGVESTSIRRQGDAVVSFASNDYLGLTRHPVVLAAAHDALDRWGTGAGAARLLGGSRPVHDDLEAELARWRSTEAAAVFPSGYATNLGVLTTFGGAGVRICSDERNHASIVDGCRLARAEVAVYRHLDLDHLDSVMAGAERAIVVTDTVFSMDGDVAPVEELAERCARRGALLVLDEAHAVLGPDPALAGFPVLRVGTLSKALASAGGFVAGPRRFVELVVNAARSYIFTTAPAPAAVAAAAAALGITRRAEGDVLRARLRARVAQLAAAHPSPIVPLVVGSEAAAVDASAALLARGLLVPAIRPPTVAPGTARLRVSLSAAHTEDQVDALARALSSLGLAATVGS